MLGGLRPTRSLSVAQRLAVRIRQLPYEDKAVSPVARLESAVAVARERMLIIGGYAEPDLVATNSVWAYGPAQDRWERRSNAPRELRHLTAAVVDDRFVWIVGGFEGQRPGQGIKASFRYDFDDDWWESGPPLPAVRASGCLALRERTLHYFGGLDPNHNTNRGDHWGLDVDHPARWERLAPMPLPRAHSAAAEVDGLIYAIGGHFGADGPGRLSNDKPDVTHVHRYDVTRDRWEAVAPLARPRSHCESGTFVHKGKIVCVGGRSNVHTLGHRSASALASQCLRQLQQEVKARLRIEPSSFALDDVIAYNPVLDRWEDLGRLPERLYAPAAAAVSGDVIVTNGGLRGSRNPSSRTLKLSLTRPASWPWTKSL